MDLIGYFTCVSYLVTKLVLAKLSTVKPVLRCHFWEKKKCRYKTGDLLKEGNIHMEFSMAEQEKGDLPIQVTA